MSALLNISYDAARDLEDNFVTVLNRELKGDPARARDLARQLIERLDLSGYQIGREELHHEEDEEIDPDVEDYAADAEMPAGWDGALTLFLAPASANDA